MSNEPDECIWETRASVIRSLRIFYWITAAIMPAFFVMFTLGGAGQAKAAVLSAVALAIVLANGYRTVIGVRVYSDRLQIITPLDRQEFPWSRVTLMRFPAIFMCASVQIKGKRSPFSMIFLPSELRAAGDAMENARRRSSGLPD